MPQASRTPAKVFGIGTLLIGAVLLFLAIALKAKLCRLGICADSMRSSKGSQSIGGAFAVLFGLSLLRCSITGRNVWVVPFATAVFIGVYFGLVREKGF